MVQRVLIIGAALVLLVAGAVGVFLFREPEAASAPIEAIPLATAAPTVAPTAAPAATAAPTVAAAATAAPAAAPAEASAPTLFEIIPAESQARFLIDEVLRGSPITVVGSTSQVAAQIAIDPANLAVTQLGVVQVNVRDIATDSSFRDRAIKNAILNTNSYEFVTFSPSELIGLPASATIGESYSFQVAGDLTIRDVTRPVVFDVTVNALSADRIEGLASTSFLYRDFGLSIPDSPSVDTVADELRLELQFVAAAAGA